jgi:hypothetical protein
MRVAREVTGYGVLIRSWTINTAARWDCSMIIYGRVISQLVWKQLSTSPQLL